MATESGAPAMKTGRDEEYDKKFKSVIQDPEEAEGFFYGKFPEGFLLGAATSAYQIEGGWDADGKGMSMWDHAVKTRPGFIEDGSNGDEGCDSYHRYKEDVKILKELNANVYRFSLSWARILPDGNPENINQGGIDYYNNLINELLANGIEPIVTLYHWDPPRAVSEKYSLRDEEILGYFVDFARVCFDNFGDRVKYWITLNELWVHAILAYDIAVFPPFLSGSDSAYKAVHNQLKIHASIYRMYEAEFKGKQNGRVGISFDCFGYEPMDPDSEEDVLATEKAYAFRLGLVLDPLTYGDYPQMMRDIVDAKCKAEGATESRLPRFDAEWSKKLKGCYDFLGLNHYTCEKVTTPERAPLDAQRIVMASDPTKGLGVDSGVFTFHDLSWPASKTWWLKCTPWALRELLNRIKNQYGNPEVIITENGWSEDKDLLEDRGRLNFYKAYLNEALKAVVLDGCNLKGYCAWTLLDCWEWSAGHTVSFGLYQVDLTDPLRKRTPRSSAKYVSQIYGNRGFLK